MLRAKAIKFKKGGVGAGEQFLASTDVHGKFAGIPVVVQAANAINRTQPARKLLDKAGIPHALHIGVGEVGETVAKYVKKLSAQQVAMGTRGLGPLRACCSVR
jgi:nucleotide-binding universal stress UspA family protein